MLPGGLPDAVRDAVIFTDAEGRIQYWNDAASELFGYSATEMLGRTPAVLYPDVSADAPAEQLSTNLAEIAGGTPFAGPWKGRHKDGRAVWVEVETTTVRSEAGDVLGFLGISRDISGRLAAEAALRFSEGQFRALAESASDGIIAVDTDSTILFANDGVGRIFGYAPDELLGTDLTRLMPEYLRHIHRAGMARYLETGVRHIHWASTELPGQHRDGHQIPLEISFGESRSGARHVFTGIIRDITSRKRTERRLTVENTVAQVLARSTSDEPVLVAVLGAAGAALAWPWGALWVRDKTADVMRCAEIWSGDPVRYAEFAAISRLRPMARGEGLPGRVWLSGEPAWSSDVVEDRNFPRALHARAAGLHAGIAFPVQRRGEVEAVIEFLGDRVEEPDAELLRLMASVGGQIGEFIERRQVEAALEVSEERYRSLVQATAQLVWACDPVGNVVEELPSWSGYTGQRFEAYRGLGWTEAVHPEDREPLLAAWKGAVAGRVPLREIEARIRRADGEYGSFGVRAVPIFGAEGELREWVGTCSDITARKRSEERLRQADRLEAVGRLAGGVAHESNNQMSVVLGSAHFLLRRTDLPEVARQDVRYIQQAAERTAVISAQLLAFSRRQMLQPKPLDLAAEVRSLEPILRRALGEASTLDVRTHPLTGTVRADPGQLAQVLLNLTFNARDAMPEGGTLTILTRAVEMTAEQAAAHPDEAVILAPYAALVVSDTGHGMDPMTLARIFEPFFTTKPLGQGTGLGLSSVHGIIRQSGGHVWASSEPGIGTTFEIYLPSARDVPGGPEPVVAAAARGSGTVLVAEDEAVLREMISRTLRECGYSVLEAGDGEEALALIQGRAEPIHLAVVDVMMPRMSGRELAIRLEHQRPGTRVLFISGFPDLEAVERGLLEGGQQFLQKPFAPETLARAVKDLLA